MSILDGDKSVDRLAGQLISDTNDSGLRDGMVVDEGSLNLSSRETMAGNVDNVVNTSTDPVVAVMITSSSVTSKLS